MACGVLVCAVVFPSLELLWHKNRTEQSTLETEQMKAFFSKETLEKNRWSGASG